MRRAARLAGVFAGAVAVSACALTVQKPVAFGREVRVKTTAESGVVAAKGELITADGETLIVLTPEGTLREIPASAVKKVSVRRHGFGGKDGLLWTLFGAGLTGGALAASCSTVTDGCEGVLGYTAAWWAVIGGVSSLFLQGSTYARAAPGWDLRRYARYPQGLPDGLDAATLLGKPWSEPRARGEEEAPAHAPEAAPAEPASGAAGPAVSD